MIQCYFGNGKGKTTASVGAAIRYLGCNKKVLYVSFLKNATSSELNILKNLPGLTLKIPPVSYQLFDNRNAEKNKEFFDAYTMFFQEELNKMASEFDMIVLDEILDVLKFSYLSQDLFSNYLKSWSKTTEIVLTGHRITPQIFELCDYVSEISAHKHPYEKGMAARKGIEF